MNDHEQRMCELQAEIFENSIKRFSCSSSFFIARFMNGANAKELDDKDNSYNYYSPNYILDALTYLYPSLNNKEGEKYPIHIMRWIGYVYRAWSIISKRSSYDIYKIIKSDKLLSFYDSFHTFGIDYCIERLEEIANEGLAQKKSDYEIFKEIMLKKDQKVSTFRS